MIVHDLIETPICFSSINTTSVVTVAFVHKQTLLHWGWTILSIDSTWLSLEHPAFKMQDLMFLNSTTLLLCCLFTLFSSLKFSRTAFYFYKNQKLQTALFGFIVS